MRVVLVTRRFWPLVGESQTLLSHLSAEFLQHGVQPTIVTAQWNRDWPTELSYREVPLVRLSHPGRGVWGRTRYLRTLSRWLADRQRDIDLVCVSGLKREAYTVLGVAKRSSTPVVLRSTEVAARGDCYWQNSARGGAKIRRRCQTADAIIASNQTTESELLESGYTRSQVHRIAEGVSLPAMPNAEARVAARLALTDAHQVLAVAEHSPLVVYAGPLHADKGLQDLLAAWPSITKRWPNARLWLIGQGPQLDDLWDTIKHRDMAHQVILTGSFDHMDDVLQAADLFVMPSHSEGMSVSLLEAMATGLRIVATDVPGNRELIVHPHHGLLVPPHDVTSMSQAMIRLLDDPSQAVGMGKAARLRVAEHFSLTRMASSYVQLFQRLLAEKKR